MSRFAGLKTATPTPAETPETAPAEKAKGRDGLLAVAGYFPPEVRKQLKMIAAEESVSIQHLIGEGLDAVMRARGKHPFGYR